MSEKEFEVLFKKQFASLCNLAFTLVKNSDIAKDVVQQVFIKLWHKKQEISIQTSIEAYLYRMVINTALNQIEKDKKYTRLDDHPAELMNHETKNLEDNTNEEREKKVRDAIDELPRQCQTVFYLSRFGDLSNKEIAIKLGISVKAVEKHITIALKSLRIKLKPLFKSEFVLFLLLLKFLITQVGFFTLLPVIIRAM